MPFNVELRFAQILKLNENDVVSIIIRDGIERLDAASEDSESNNNGDSSSVTAPHSGIVGTEHVSLGSSQTARTLHYVETEFYGLGNQRAFKNFRRELSKSLSMIHQYYVCLNDSDEVSTKLASSSIGLISN